MLGGDHPLTWVISTLAVTPVLPCLERRAGHAWANALAATRLITVRDATASCGPISTSKIACARCHSGFALAATRLGRTGIILRARVLP